MSGDLLAAILIGLLGMGVLPFAFKRNVVPRKLAVMAVFAQILAGLLIGFVAFQFPYSIAAAILFGLLFPLTIKFLRELRPY